MKYEGNLLDIGIIAKTAFATNGGEERIRRGGCKGYISDPISIATFLETVTEHIG